MPTQGDDRSQDVLADAAEATRAAGPSAARTSSVRGLLMVNGVLLGVLALVTLAPNVGAQAARVRGDYAVVAGAANGSNKASVVYIADVVNQELIAVLYNVDERTLTGVAARNLRADAADLLGGRIKTAPEGSKGGATR